MDPLSVLHPVIQRWFVSRFGTPTEAQALGWPAIAEGRHTLISAPTGSGKTLAAFLMCLDRLFRAGIKGELPDSAQVVYVSPLKALSNDIHRNLSLPLQEIMDLARAEGLTAPQIRIALRTGDTPAYERQATARKPPHVWITTPESLFILLTSESGRKGLSGVRTLILDEIHSIAGSKRGSHLSISVERLCRLAGAPVVRIGLSATVRPIEDAARLLVGSRETDSHGRPQCKIVNTGHLREMDLQMEMPGGELGPIASHELWDETIDRIAALSREHRTTLVFVNTRRLVERVAHLLSPKLGEENIAAHHGSLSRKTRLHTEERLKRGDVRVCIATSSLELGIDIGAIDLVCQIGSPRSIGVLLQRVGRSGHSRAFMPKGRVFPLTRDELIECTALIYAIRQNDLDRLSIPPWPLDVLSQQIVSMCAAEDWGLEDLYNTLRCAFPYRELPRAAFDGVVKMLGEGFASRLGRNRAYLHYDGINGILRGRRGARLAAITSGGTIPDNADYDVISEPDGTFVGSVTEDFAVESVGGDVFLLGNTSWRIRRVEKGKVRVEDARGQAPNVPFWLGEAPARSPELSRVVSNVREGIARRLPDRDECIDWLVDEAGLAPVAAEQAYEYIAEGKRVLGAVPTQDHIIAERFFDESGGMQLVLHAPYGARINKAWGLALRKRFCRSFDFELQASATDDGINLSLGPQHSFPINDLFLYLRANNLNETLVQAVLASPVFVTRWRWTLTRSLALLRFSGGKRVPAPIQRMRSDDLLAAIFPVQAQCQDNRSTPDIEIPEHPLVFETLRDCLTEALDIEGLRHVLEKMERGEIQFSGKDTPMPSVFAHQILNAMPYAFLDDAPLEERRARAVILRRALPERADELGRLDPEAIRSAAEDAWPAIRDANELHDALLGFVLFPDMEIGRLPAEAGAWMASLVREKRASMESYNGRLYWMAAESKELLCPAIQRELNQDQLIPIVRGWIEVSGPVTVTELEGILGFPAGEVRSALIRLEGEGLVLRGSFSEKIEEEFCDRRILARIHRATIAHLRREIEPVPAATFLRFLFEWQHATPGTQLEGAHGVLEIIEQFQGFEAAAAAWESELLHLRIPDYEPSLLDSLCLAGEVVWGRWKRRATQAENPARRPGLTRSAPIGLGLRENMPWLLDGASADESALSPVAQDILTFLRARGASFFPEIAVGARHLPAEIEDGLWQLVAAGLVTADSFAALRSLISGETKRAAHPRRKRQPRRTREGRWSLLEIRDDIPSNRTELWAQQFIRRYGVFCRELLVRESTSPPWRELLRVLRRSEARGEIRGGRFIAGLNGEQFALPEAVEALRAMRRKEASGGFLRVSACDPLNLAGILTPGPRIASIPGNRVVYRDGVPVAFVENEATRILAEVESDETVLLKRLLDPRPLDGPS